MLVREGEIVSAGDVLVRLDPTIAQVNLNMATGRLFELEARAARLEAEISGEAKVSYSDELVQQAKIDDNVRRVLEGQSTHLTARRASVEAQQQILTQQTEQLRDQIRGLEGLALSKTRQVQILKQELKGLRTLFQKGLTTQTRILALAREAERLTGEIAQHQSDISGAETQIAEVDLQRLRLEREIREKASGELQTVEAELANVREQRIASEDRVRRADIVAPHDGRVLNLAVHTEGAVIAPGAPLMEIVPDGGKLVVLAEVPPESIDDVSVGDAARLRFLTDGERFALPINGLVSDISADSLLSTQGSPYYRVEISLPDDLSETHPALDLRPGMPVDVFIKTGTRSAIAYLLSPLTEAMQRTFREG